MGGRGASSASGAANVRKVRNYLRGEGFSVVFALPGINGVGRLR